MENISPELPSVQIGKVPPQLHSPVSNMTDRVLALAGYALIMVAVISFIAIVILEYIAGRAFRPFYNTWLELVSHESMTLILMGIGVITALLGGRLLTNTQASYVRTIPNEDYGLISDAVVAGKSEPIDQYVRLRSLSGWAGTFTKLGSPGFPW